MASGCSASGLSGISSSVYCSVAPVLLCWRGAVPVDCARIVARGGDSVCLGLWPLGGACVVMVGGAVV